jgi:twitching motility protein PilT
MAGFDIDQLLRGARHLNASDIHLKVGRPPLLRIKGELRSLKDATPLSSETVAQVALKIMGPQQREKFLKELEIDLGFSGPDGDRFRTNIFRQRGEMGIAIRVIPRNVPAFSTLNLPEVIAKMALEPRGMVLVTGITGSGKSTTLAAMIDHINDYNSSHIVTIEDPIEYVHTDKRSVVNQRELGIDTVSFARALKSALRQDPDVILVGEMRDLETISTAISAAETGHMVFSTLHTLDATETVNRVLSAFSDQAQAQARRQLASVLTGIVSQRLVPRADGKGMVPITEILVATERVRELIENPERTRELREAIASGRDPYGMMTFDQSLMLRVKAGLVSYEEALLHATSRDDFALMSAGIETTSEMDWNQVAAAAQPDSLVRQVPQSASQNSFEIERFHKPK